MNDDIQNYITNLNDENQQSINDFVSFMKTEFPHLKPKICFAMPIWLIGEKMHEGYVAISAAKNHYSIHIHDEHYITVLKTHLPKCKFGKECINVRYTDKESIEIVKKYVREYLEKNI